MSDLLIDSILQDILRKEGSEYTNIPGDLGGPTKFGITLNTLQDFRKAPCTAVDVMQLEVTEANLIYTQEYIAPFMAYVQNEWLLRLLVDSSVQHGVDRVKQWLVDAGVNTSDPETLRRKLFIRRLQFYGAIITDRPTNAKFAKGWMIRLSSFAR